MSAIDKVLAFIAPNTAKKLEARSRIEPVSQLDLAHYLGGGVSWTNIDIDRLTVMGLPVMWACIKVLSETLASFPLVLYEGTSEGQTRNRAEDHPIFDLLHNSPNPYQDAFSFKEQMMGHLCVYGNCYAYIEMGGSGYIKSLMPLNPERMFPFRLNGELLYRYRASPYFQTQDLFFRSQNDNEKRKNDFSTMGDPQKAGYFQWVGKAYPDQIESILTANEVFHIHGFGFDGIRGYSPLELQRETCGLAIAAKHYAADFFANDGTPSIAFLHNQHLTDQATRRLQDSWKQNHARWGRKHTPIILEEGMQVKELSLAPDKAQLIEIQKFLVTEICRIYRVQPHMVQDLERATFSNIEHQDIEFVKHTMRPWAIRWESAISRQLLSEKDRKKYYPEFWMDAILRGDAITRAQVYQAQIGSGMLSPNDARRREQLNDREGGDTYYIPLNWVDASNPPEPVTKPKPGIEDTPEEDNSNLVSKEVRTIRSARSRRAIANSFGILLKDSAARIVRKECRDLRKAISEQLKLRDANTFAQWMEKYYREMPDYIKKQITPVYQAFSNAIRAEIANELGIDETVRPEDEQFVRQFVEIFTKRYISASTGQIQSLIRDTSAQAMADTIDERLDEWEDNRAEKITTNEKTQASNAFARNIYMLAGIASLVWMAMGAKPCEYCQHMDGMKISIHDDFAYDGEDIPDERSLGIGKNIGHPPLHRGCECQITAG